MIKRIHIKNFQSLKDVEIHTGNVTVIKGTSDTGKSAFIRALNSLLTGHLPAHFIRSGTHEASVLVETDDGYIEVSRAKGGSTVFNINGTEFSKLGMGVVPEEMWNFIGNPEIKVDKDLKVILNIQEQHKSMFLIQNTPATEVAKVMGFISKLNLLYVALRSMINQESNLKSSIMSDEAELKPIQERLKNLSVVHDLKVTDTLISIDKQISFIGKVDKAGVLAESIKDIKLYNIKKVEKLVESVTTLSEEFNKYAELEEKAKAVKEEFKAIKLNIIPIYDFEKTEKQAELIEKVATAEKAMKAVTDIKIVEVEMPEFKLSDIEGVEVALAMFEEVTRLSLICEDEIKDIEKAELEMNTLLKENPICPLTMLKYKEGCLEEICQR